MTRPDDQTRLSDDATRLEADDATRLEPAPATPSASTSSSGWLTSSGSIDHGRFAPGEMVDGRYRIIGLIGRGGMGEVFRADDLRLGQPVALKFLPPSLGQDPIRLAQFHNEVRTARQVSHPNVCRVYDIGDVQGQPYLTMEFVDGEDLASLLRRIGRLPEDKALEISKQICAGLAAAHERGILHRDLKPANVMLDGSGRVRIMDFSLAAAGAVSDVRAGTPAYMAPEQLQGREVTTRSDIFALGLVLFELFTGRRVFTAASIHELVSQHESGVTTSVTDIVRSVDANVERAIRRCLHPDPALRPASALAVLAELGADPLAAAMAAGETPSPEMVAAAGGTSAAFGPVAGAAWLAAAAVMAVGVAALADRVNLVSRIPLTKPAAVLIDRAQAVTRDLGYTEPVADRAHGYRYDGDYLNWATANLSHEAWAMLPLGRPAALRFWYRSSPRLLIPFNPFTRPQAADPPTLITGMTGLELDPDGRLLTFVAVPPQVVRPDDAPGLPADWAIAFEAAGLPMDRFRETAPGWTPRTHSDERRAWEGELAELPGRTVRVEAAAYRGRPVMFEVVGPWTRPSRDVAFQSAGTSRFTSSIGALIIVLIPIGAAFLARRNVRLGRGDRRGALALGSFVFLLTMALWVVGRSHVASMNDEIDRFFLAVGNALLQGGMLFAVYLAVEPYVRRVWPNVLITWARITTGSWRDPLVGRDVAIGVVIGLALTLLSNLYNVLPPLVGRPEPTPSLVDLSSLMGARDVLVAIGNRVLWALQNALIGVMVLALPRLVITRNLGPFPRDWIIAAIVTLIFTIVSTRNTVASGYLWFEFAYAAFLSLLLVVALLRFGLFATTVTFFVYLITTATPLTLDGTKLFATASWWTLGLVVALSAAGVRLARQGRL